jgi:hypothetical protein
MSLQVVINFLTGGRRVEVKLSEHQHKHMHIIDIKRSPAPVAAASY